MGKVNVNVVGQLEREMNLVTEYLLICSATVFITHGQNCGEDTLYTDKYLDVEKFDIDELNVGSAEFLAHLNSSLPDCKKECCDRDDCTVVAFENIKPRHTEIRRCFLYKCVPLSLCESELKDQPGLDTYFIEKTSFTNDEDNQVIETSSPQSVVLAPQKEQPSGNSQNVTGDKQEDNQGLELDVQENNIAEQSNNNMESTPRNDNNTPTKNGIIKPTNNTPTSTTKPTTKTTTTSTTTTTMPTPTTTKKVTTAPTKPMEENPQQNNNIQVNSQDYGESFINNTNTIEQYASSRTTTTTTTSNKITISHKPSIEQIVTKKPFVNNTTQQPVSNEPSGNENQQTNISQSFLSSASSSTHPSPIQPTTNKAKNNKASTKPSTEDKDRKVPTGKTTSPSLETTSIFQYLLTMPNYQNMSKINTSPKTTSHTTTQKQSSPTTRTNMQPTSSFAPSSTTHPITTHRTSSNTQQINMNDTYVSKHETSSNETVTTSNNHPINVSLITTPTNRPINENITFSQASNSTSSLQPTLSVNVSSENMTSVKSTAPPEHATEIQQNETVTSSDSKNNSVFEITDFHTGYGNKPGKTSNVLSAALIGALSFGILFFIAVMALVGKRCFDSWQRRHYSRIDFLVNGMYN